MRRTHIIPFSLLVVLAACGGDGGGNDNPDAAADAVNVPDAVADVEDDSQPDVGSDATADVPSDVEQGCVETIGDLPDSVEWLVLDGQSDEFFGLSDNVLSGAVDGQFGTYDLNRLEAYGGNGFRTDAPMTVYAAQVRWTNLGAEPAEATVVAWPDFSSDGYVFDVDNPIAESTRCLTDAAEGEWQTHVFAEPISFEQPEWIFVGYHRPEIADGEGSLVPEILFENFRQEEEPYYAGIRWPDFDEELYYGGQVSPWNTWQVRLAVVRHDDIAADDKPFHPVEGFRAGSRVAWGDYDNDGWDDLMTNGPTLYRNNGGTLVDVSADALPESTGTSGGIWGDYDNDGCVDYFGQGRPDVLLRNNCDGTFTNVTEESGVNDLQDVRDCDGDGLEEASPTEGAAWADVDGDGFLDLYLANYECSSEHDYYQNYRDRLWINQGDGTFEERSRSFGISDAFHAGRGVTTVDIDRDCDTDIFVSNYRLDPNFFYENIGGDELFDVAIDVGVQGVETQGAYGHTIGTAAGDIDNDGDFDLIAANLAHPFYYHFSDLSMVLMNDDGEFTDEAAERGIIYRETHSNPVLFDADNDGDLDLFVTCVYRGRDSDFYENDGGGYFTLRNYESGLVVDNGWGAAASDFDNDGDVDLAAYELFENRSDSGAWLQVRAIGTRSNRSAIGTTIEVEAGGITQLRQVSGGSGTSSQDSFTQHFGLPVDVSTVERVTIHFPNGNGADVVLNDVDANQRVYVTEDGDVTYGWDPPAVD